MHPRHRRLPQGSQETNLGKHPPVIPLPRPLPPPQPRKLLQDPVVETVVTVETAQTVMTVVETARVEVTTLELVQLEAQTSRTQLQRQVEMPQVNLHRHQVPVMTEVMEAGNPPKCNLLSIH